jgi:superkiller protein 3
VLRQGIENKPIDEIIWNNRGLDLAKVERLNDALASLDKALEVKPCYYQAWGNKGAS